MSDRTDIDALMIGGLYDELDATDKARLDSHLEGNPQARRELDALRRTRAALRELPDVDPPPALTAMLMHEAAKHAPARRAAATEPRKKGLAAWFGGLFQSLALHPAAAALATLVLVGGVAGTLYLRNEWKQAEPAARSHAPAPVSEQAHAGSAAPAPATAPLDDILAAEQQPGFAVDLATKGDLGNNEADEAAAKAQNRIAATTADPSKNAPARRGAGEKERWLEANAVSGTDPLLDGTEETATAAAGPADGYVAAEGKLEAPAREQASKDARKGSIIVETPEPNLRDTPGEAAPEVAVDARLSDKPDTSKAKKQVATAPPPPSSPSAGASGTGGAVYRAPDSDDAGEDARTVEWAKTQHTRLRTAFKSKKCADVARLANDILDRAPDYYLSSVAGTKDVKGCQVYVNQEARKRGELRAKSRATRANPAADFESDASE